MLTANWFRKHHRKKQRITLLFARHPPAAVDHARMNFTKNIGMLLLAIYLILVGIVSLFTVPIPAMVLGILALLAGIFILIGK